MNRISVLTSVLSQAIACGFAAADQAVVDFDHYPGGAAVQPGDVFTTQWTSVGVVFSRCGPANNPCSYSPPNHASDGRALITATFVDPCTRRPSPVDYAGTRQDFCWFPGEGIDMYAYDAQGNLLDHQFNAGGGNLTAFSFPQRVIARLDMVLVLQGIDDFVLNVPSPDPCPADLSDDGTVDVDDLFGVINAWGDCGLGACPGNINCDDVVDIDDLFGVINAWGPCAS